MAKVCFEIFSPNSLYTTNPLSSSQSKGKGKAKDVESEVASEDSMAMDIDAMASDFEEPDSDEPAPKKTAGKKKAAAPAKKAPSKGRGKKAAVLVRFHCLILNASSDCCFVRLIPTPTILWRSMMMATMNPRRRREQIGLHF